MYQELYSAIWRGPS